MLLTEIQRTQMVGLKNILFVLFGLLVMVPAGLYAQGCNANFTYTVTGCNAVSFSPDTLNTSFTYTWDFGDGTKSNTPNPVHNLTSYGAGKKTFTVKLTVNSTTCGSNTVSKDIVVDQVPDASIEDKSGNKFVSCSSGVLTILNTSSTKSSNTSYNIEWGDGSTPLSIPTFSELTNEYYDNKFYYLKLTVTGSNGCISKDTISFIYSATPNIGAGLKSSAPICLPGDVPIDISGVSENTPNTTYEVVANNGSKKLVFNHPPPATIYYRFDSTACGTNSTINSKEYFDAFQVSITAYTGCPNQSASASVGPIRTITPPKADFEVTPGLEACQSEVFKIKNTSKPGLFWESTPDDCTNKMRVVWSITPSTGYTLSSGSLTDSAGFSLTFQVPGTYSIRLIVENKINSNPNNSDPSCAADTLIKTICVLPVPMSSFTKSASGGCVPLINKFTNTSNTLNSCTSATYEWTVAFTPSDCGATESYTFLNNTNKNSISPDIRFDAPGEYSVSLKVTNKCGTHTFTDKFIVAGTVISSIIPIADSCGQVRVQPTLKSTSLCPGTPPIYTWTFPAPNAGTYTGEQPPVRTYSVPGTYTIKLQTQGCSNTETTETFTVFPVPKLPAISANTPCPGSSLIFTNPDTVGVTCSWTGPNGFTSKDCAPVIPNVSAANAGEYCLTVTNPSNCSVKTCITVSVFDKPTIKVAQDTTHICIGQSATLSASGGVTYTWTPTANMIPANGQGASVSVKPLVGIWPYVVQGTNGTNCSSKDTAVVIVHGFPTASITKPGVVCTGKTLTLAGQGSVKGAGTWSTASPAIISAAGVFSSGQKGKFPVFYTFSDQYGCPAPVVSDTVCVIQSPTASITASSLKGCIPFEVQFNNNSSTVNECEVATYKWTVQFNAVECSPASGKWSFISGTDTSFQPKFRFDSIGQYVVTLTVTNACGTQSVSQTVEVGGVPRPVIQPIADLCGPSTLIPKGTIKSCNATITEYNWLFEGGTPASSTAETPPPVAFSALGNHVVSLSVKNTCGTSVVKDTFSILQRPAVAFNLGKEKACKGEALTPTNTSTGTNLGYKWSASGPGRVQFSNVTAAQPSLTFPDSGVYIITLSVGNAVCDTIRVTDTILINQAPTVDLLPIKDECGQATVTPVANFVTQSRIDKVRWTFPSIASVQSSDKFVPGSFTINQKGTYTVKVQVENNCNVASDSVVFRILEGPIAKFELDSSFACKTSAVGTKNSSTGDDLKYAWSATGPKTIPNFGGGEASREPKISFPDTGVYVVTLKLSNSVCAGVSVSDTILISEKPTVDLAMIKDECGQATVTPVAIYSTLSRIDKVSWTFPSNASMQSSDKFVPGSITINKTGSYQIKVQVENRCGMAMDSSAFRILEGPVAKFQLDTSFACKTANIGIKNTSTGDDLKYAWSATGPKTTPNFGGGEASKEPKISFPDTGVYVVTLKLSNSVCAGVSVSDTILISEKPTVDLAMIKDECGQATVTPVATFTTQSRIDKVNWTFPSNASMQSSDKFEPGSITINKTGSYQIKVQVENRCGMAMDSSTFRILEGPVAKFDLDSSFACKPANIGTKNSSTGDDLKYAWSAVGLKMTANFGGGETSREPKISFPDTGVYVVTLKLSNSVCAGVSLSDTILISEKPTVELAMIPDACGQATVTPVATYSTLSRIDKVSWTFPPNATVKSSDKFVPGSFDINENGEHIVQVQVENRCGTAMASTKFRVFKGPVADFQLDSSFACKPVTVGIKNNSTGDGLIYSWSATVPKMPASFGGGETSKEPKITFPDTGVYVVTLKLSNSVCSSVSMSDTILISDVPTVDLVMIENACGQVTLTPSAKYSDKSRIDKVSWTFPSQASIQSSDKFEPGSLTINKTGSYQIKVQVENRCGMAMDTSNFRVLEGPVAKFQLDTSFACKTANVGIKNSSTGEDLVYAWSALGPTTTFRFDGGEKIKEPKVVFPDTGIYVVTLAVGNSVCADVSMSDTILISELPTVDLATIKDACGEVTLMPSVDYSAKSRIDKVSWTFPSQASIQSSDKFDPGSLSINQRGSYQIKVQVENRCGMAMDTANFRVLEGPVAKFQLDTSFACKTANVGIKNSSTGDDLVYVWSASGPKTTTDFGGGEKSKEPKIVFPDTGVYVITLAVGNSVCADVSLSDTILISELPTVDLATIKDACGEVTLMPSVDYSAKSRIDKVSWTFPAQASIQSSDKFDPGSLSINQRGSYQIKVQVENRCGMAMDTSNFRVLEGPVAKFQLDTSFACKTANIGIKNSSTGDDLVYAWSAAGPKTTADFDGGEKSKEPKIVFPDTGVYVITLAVGNSVCADVSMSDTILISELPTVELDQIDDACEQLTFLPKVKFSDITRIDQVAWVFPEAANIQRSSQFFPESITIDKTGRYQVSVQVKNGCGTAADTVSFKLLEGPVAIFELDTSFACKAAKIATVNTSTGDDLIYTWSAKGPTNTVDFEGGAAAMQPQINFPDTGVFVVTLKVGNSVCAAVSTTDTILISQTPSVKLAEIKDACGQITFTPNPEFSDISRIDNVSWVFPEETGTTTFDKFFPPSLSINTTGDFKITVNVKNGCGNAEAMELFSVLTPIQVDAELSTDKTCDLPAKIQVTNKSIGDRLNFKWQVEGEFSSNTDFIPTDKNPQITFKDTGVYVIIQDVYNDVCGTFSWRDTLTVMTKPQPVLTGQDRFCEEVSLTPIINYLKYRIDSVQWNFPGGDPVSASALFPKSIGYSKGGEYRYTLQAFNFCGSTIVSDTIFIDTIPLFDLGPTDTICMNEGIYQIPPATPFGGIWLDSLQRAGVVTQSGQFDPNIARGGITSVEYKFTTGACTVSEYKDVLVIDLSYVDAGPDINTCISDSLVVLKGGMPGGGWYLGAGVTDTLQGYFSPDMLAEGMYTLTYNYQLAGTNCIQRDPFTAFVRPLPVPGLQVTDSVCVQVPVVLNNQSQGATGYLWRVDPEQFYDQKSPRHIFVDTGFHTVQLTAISAYGCMDSISTELYVSAPPIVSFEKDTSMGCAVLPVHFTNKTIGFKSVRYSWNFGDGSPLSTLEQPETVFYQQGLEDTTYHIKLTATNVCGTSSYRDSVLVFPKPLADMRINQKFNCTPSRVVFNNLTRGLPDTFEWYVDGTLFSTDSIAPNQILRAPGPDNSIYKIELIAFNECGTDTSVQVVTVKPDSIRAFFEVDLTEGCEPLQVSFKNSSSPDSLVVYNWFFDQDNHTSNAKDTSFTFFAARDTTTEYRVTLLANNGCSENMFSTDIRVYPSPVVTIEAQDYACARADVPFSSPAKEINGYLWEFGDQTTSTETFPKHAFRESGTYPVQLTAYSARNGCPGKATKAITIRPLPDPQLEANALFGCPPHQVTLKNTTDRPDRYYYLWDFGDGGSKVGPNPGSYVYKTSGEYPITLRATDQFGCAKDTTYVKVNVFPQPEARFTAVPTEPCGLPQTICFQNTSINSDAYTWNFGNGQPISNLRNPCTVYSQAGVRPVQLIAQNSYLCSDTLSTTVEAFDFPIADFEAVNPVLCEDAIFQIRNLSQHATYFRWRFANFSVDTAQQPVLQINDPGVYSAGLIVGNGSGCMDTLYIADYLEVLPSPVAGLRIEKDPTLPPSTFQFMDESSPDAIAFGWDLSGGIIKEEKNTTHRFISRFDRNIAHWVTNAYDCTDTVFQLLNLDTLSGLFIPNILEPSNLQSEKQLFTPKGIGLESWHLAIYTRSGQLVWETTALDEEGSPSESWDGVFLDGAIPAGALVWKVHYARFIDGSYWAGMPDEKGKLRRHGVVYLVR